MSYHNDPYRVDYLKIYPCLKERPDVLEVLKKSDRKMKYMEVDLKSEQRRKNAENGAESYIPSKEDSLERLVHYGVGRERRSPTGGDSKNSLQG